jgi:hypothetical protein
MILEKQLLFRVLTQVLANLRMLNIHIIPQLVQLLSDSPQVVIILWFDNKLVIIKSVQIHRRLNHLL